MKGMRDYARKSYLLWVIVDIAMIMKILLGIIIILNLLVKKMRKMILIIRERKEDKQIKW